MYRRKIQREMISISDTKKLKNEVRILFQDTECYSLSKFYNKNNANYFKIKI